MKTNPYYWQNLPNEELFNLHKTYEQFRKPVKQKQLPRKVKSLQDLLFTDAERSGIELIIYNECVKRGFIQPKQQKEV